jgi:hypothetical protein
MSQRQPKKGSLSKKYKNVIEQDMYELQKKRECLSNLTPNVIEEVHFKIELIHYLKAELANTKAELAFLKQAEQKDASNNAHTK